MILHGNVRGGAKDLALHLMKDENDHVELHDLRGFACGDLMGALNEAHGQPGRLHGPRLDPPARLLPMLRSMKHHESS